MTGHRCTDAVCGSIRWPTRPHTWPLQPAAAPLNTGSHQGQAGQMPDPYSLLCTPALCSLPSSELRASVRLTGAVADRLLGFRFMPRDLRLVPCSIWLPCMAPWAPGRSGAGWGPCSRPPTWALGLQGEVCVLHARPRRTAQAALPLLPGMLKDLCIAADMWSPSRIKHSCTGPVSRLGEACHGALDGPGDAPCKHCGCLCLTLDTSCQGCIRLLGSQLGSY